MRYRGGTASEEEDPTVVSLVRPRSRTPPDPRPDRRDGDRHPPGGRRETCLRRWLGEPYGLRRAYTQDFNTLAASGTSSSVPLGWDFAETGTNANTTYTAGSGSGNTGDTYSFGVPAVAERAYGGLLSGNLIPTIGASFTNDIGSAIVSANISYTGEQWRVGTLAREDRLDFQYSIDATSLTTGTWTNVDSLDFVAPTTTGVIGQLDGNAAPNRTGKVGVISGLAVAPGATIWIVGRTSTLRRPTTVWRLMTSA